MRGVGILWFQRVVAGCATISLTAAAVIARTHPIVPDSSTLLLFLTTFGIAAAVTGSAGRWPVRILGWVGGVGSITGFAMYLLGSALSVWAFAGAAALALLGGILLLRSAPGPKAR